jgi:hypothetical protein
MRSTEYPTGYPVLQVLFLSVFILQVVMHGEESQVPGDLRQSEILIEQDFKI